jgi:hypothetical protein
MDVSEGGGPSTQPMDVSEGGGPSTQPMDATAGAGSSSSQDDNAGEGVRFLPFPSLVILISTQLVNLSTGLRWLSSTGEVIARSTSLHSLLHLVPDSRLFKRAFMGRAAPSNR